MYTKTLQREGLFSRMMAVLLAVVLATSFVNLGAITPQKAWAEGAPQTVSVDHCTTVGAMTGAEDDYSLHYLKLDEGVVAVSFDEEVGSLDFISNMEMDDGMVFSNVVTLGDDYRVSRSYLEESWTLNSFADDIDFDSLYGVYVAVGDIDEYFVFETAVEAEPGAEESASLTFTVSINGEAVSQEDISVAKEGYSYKDWQGKTSTAPLYTVHIPDGTDSVFIEFSSNCLAYNYKKNPASDYDGSDYLAGAIDDYFTGIKSGDFQVDYNKDSQYDFIQVQTPYDAAWQTDLILGITFESDEESPVYPSPVDDEAEAGSVDSTALYADVFNGILSQSEYSKNVGGAGESGYQHWLALSAAALGNAGQINTSAVQAEAAADYNLPIAILQLTAAGFDCSDLVTQMASAADSNYVYDSSKAFCLMAYACGPYDDQPGKAFSVRNLIHALAENQQEDGSYGYEWGGTFYKSPDTTAMVVSALSAYSNDAEASAVLSKAVTALKAMCDSNGSYGDSCATATAIAALCAVGEDPTASVNALLSEANQSKTGFTYYGEDNKLATAQGLMALVAYQGLRDTGRAYNVYTCASQGGVSKPISTKVEDKIDGTTVSNVEGLDEIAEAVAKQPEGGKVAYVELVVSDQADSDELALLRKEIGESAGLFAFDASLIAVTESGDSIDLGDAGYGYVTFTVDFDFAGKENVKVYRVHEGEVTELPNSADAEEYALLDRTNNKITIRSAKFSSFGVAYEKSSDSGESATQASNPSALAQTGDVTDVAPAAALALCALATLCFASRRIKKD